MSMATIKLHNGEGKAFFDRLFHPDPLVLQARNTFLQSLNDNISIHREGSSIIIDSIRDPLQFSFFSQNHFRLSIESKINTFYDGDYSYTSSVHFDEKHQCSFNSLQKFILSGNYKNAA